MMGIEQTSHTKKRGIYLLPNLLTTAGIFAGFYAIVAAMKGHFDSAAIAIFVAMLADALDGRVARLMHANTEFGVQYDSLADMVSFGIAPALVLYSWALTGLGKFGWLAAFFYAVCVALRLARFNVQVESNDKRFFKGLPCPPAAGLIASMIWVLNGYIQMHVAFSIVVAIITVALAALMVSNVRYRSFKEIDFKGRIPFISLFIIILIFVAISIDPPSVLFIIFAVYGLSGPITTLLRLRKIKNWRKNSKLRQQKRPKQESKD